MRVFLAQHVVLALLVMWPANAGRLSNFLSREKEEEELMSIEDLQKKFPRVDAESLARFNATFGKETSHKLGRYLFWKDRHTVTWGAGMDEDTRWRLLVDQSTRYLNETSPELVTAELIAKPPKLSMVYDTDATDKDGNLLIQVFPKRMRLVEDPVPIELYVDALVSYMDVEMSGDDKCTLMVDFRQGRNWPNAPYRSLLGAIDELTETINDIHPQRVARALAYPMPAEGMALLNMLKPSIGSSDVPIIMIPGDSATLHEPVPKEGLLDYIDEAVIDETENRRLSLFID